MKNIILGLVVVIVGVGAGLFLVQRNRNSSVVPQNTSVPTAQRNIVSPSAPANSQTDSGSEHSLALSVTTPSDGATLTTARVTVRGRTAPGADVFVNELETRADAGGNFSVTLTLDEGENPIVVMANDESGNVAQKDLTVFYNATQ